MKTKITTLLIVSIFLVSATTLADTPQIQNQGFEGYLGPPYENIDSDRKNTQKDEWTIIDYVLPQWLIRYFDGTNNNRD